MPGFVYSPVMKEVPHMGFKIFKYHSANEELPLKDQR